MSRHRGNSEAVRNLIREIGVHRNVADGGHDSQVPHPGARVAGGNLKVGLNRVDIVDCDVAFGNI